MMRRRRWWIKSAKQGNVSRINFCKFIRSIYHRVSNSLRRATQRYPVVLARPDDPHHEL